MQHYLFLRGQQVFQSKPHWEHVKKKEEKKKKPKRRYLFSAFQVLDSAYCLTRSPFPLVCARHRDTESRGELELTQSHVSAKALPMLELMQEQP